MMGVQETPARLFYDFCLDEHVPSDHLLRGIDRHLDLADLRQSLKPFYSQMGRPSIDPELMMRMLIVGYCMGIRSERRLCEEVHLNLAYRWFCRLGLDGKVPGHSTFSKTGMAAFAGAMRCAICLRASFSAAWRRAWSGPRGSRSTRALSPPTPTSSARFQARTGSLRRSRRARFAPRANISPRSTMRRSAPPRPSRPSSSPDPIRQPSGRA